MWLYYARASPELLQPIHTNESVEIYRFAMAKWCHQFVPKYLNVQIAMNNLNFL